MRDGFGREIDYLRISITDRCNLRCMYCMPKEGVTCVPMEQILRYEEILEIVRSAAKLGIKYIKITGGEPLVRKGCVDLIRQIKAVEGIEMVTLTTNGLLLEKYLPELVDAGIDGINVSLDTTNPEKYKRITGFDGYQTVIKAIQEATKYPISVKINAVSFRFFEDDSYEEVCRLVELAKDYPVDVRFIEVMPIGLGAQFETFDHQSLYAHLKQQYPSLCVDTRKHGNGPAVYYGIDGYQGSVGLISAIHGKFCESCNRIRLTSEGLLKPCLCYNSTVDLRKVLRDGKDVTPYIQEAITHKPSAHCFEHQEQITESLTMSGIGG